MCSHNKLFFISDTYAKARKASIKAEEDSAIDTAAGETDLDKPRKRHKPARYEESDNSDIDNPDPKHSRRKICLSVNNSTDEDVPTEDIRVKVKALLENRKQLSTSLCQVQKPKSQMHEVVSLPSSTVSHNTSQSSYCVEQDTDFEGKKNYFMKTLFSCNKL